MKVKWQIYLFVSIILGVAFFYRTNWAAAQEGDPPRFEENEYFHVEEELTANGVTLHKMVIGGPPQRPTLLGTENSSGGVQAAATTQLNVPTSEWSFGCSATSAAMIAGYYDRNGYANMYVGPTDDGIYPMTSNWGYYVDTAGDSIAKNPLSASHEGMDGRMTKGGVDDYWVSYDTGGPHDPWYGNWAEHSYEYTTGDFMHTNQWDHGYENSDGATSFYYNNNNTKLYCSYIESFGLSDGTVGFKDFYESRGYSVSDCFYQLTDTQVSGGFSFADFKAEIDSGHPVMVHLEGHTIVGTGYNDSVNPPVIYLNDTWNNTPNHSMEWSATSTYAGMKLAAVSIVHIADAPYSAPSNDEITSAQSISSLPFNVNSAETRGASTAYDDPEINDCGVTKGIGSVWYTYTHSGGNSAIAIDTSGSDFDTFIAIWTGSRGNLTLVGCSNTANNSETGGFQISDGTYYIEIGKAE